MKISLVFKYIKTHYSENANEGLSSFVGLEREEVALIFSLIDSIYLKRKMVWRVLKKVNELNE